MAKYIEIHAFPLNVLFHKGNIQMDRSIQFTVALLAIAFLPTSAALAQLGGGMGGMGMSGMFGSGGSSSRSNIDAAGAPSLSELSIKEAQAHIVFEGTSEIRVKPSEIRVVMAVTSESQTAVQCQKECDQTIQKVKAAWKEIGIAKEDIVVDFIAVLPVYEWTFEKEGDATMGIEKRSGYRMQTNLHVAVPSDKEAFQAISLAFNNGVTDIIAFDYWSKELDALKVQARAKALKAAREKSEFMLGAVLDKKPPVINIQEATIVRYPESLYRSYTIKDEQEITKRGYGDVSFIHAHRPRNTYYRGLYMNGDTQSAELPMQSEISVLSTVRLYFDSPKVKVEKKRKSKNNKKKKRSKGW